MPLLKAFSSSGSAKSWGAGSPMLASANREGIGTVRGDLLRMSNGKLVMVAGRPGLGLWVATDESADEWEVFNIATAFNRLQPDPTQRFSAAFASASVNATAPCGPWHPGCDQGTGAGRGCIAEGTGYIQAVEVEPGVLLLMFDRFPWLPMNVGGAAQGSAVYTMRVRVG